MFPNYTSCTPLLVGGGGGGGSDVFIVSFKLVQDNIQAH